MEQENLASKFLGGMVGSALGDAIGEMAFFLKPKKKEVQTSIQDLLLEEVKQTKELIYTDDTAMAIGLAESILAKGKIEEQHLGDTFAENYYKSPFRGYAQGPPSIFHKVKMLKMSYRQAALEVFPGGSFGNGAAMRIAPVGLFFYDSTDLYAEVEKASAVTHAHPIGIDAAFVLALAISQATKLDPLDEFPLDSFVSNLIESARTDTMKEKMTAVQELLASSSSPQEATQRLKLSVCAQESVPFSIFSFLKYPKSYQECLYCAILHRGDRDTMGAMACAISGAYLGIHAVPTAWRIKLENYDYIADLADKLFAMKHPK
jgi:poly(ADP-ribose) glycohydrolase ARH3